MDCDQHDTNQHWRRRCGAWVWGHEQAGRMLTMADDAVMADQWTGKLEQVWDFIERMQHNQCANKKWKIMSFNGKADASVSGSYTSVAFKSGSAWFDLGLCLY